MGGNVDASDYHADTEHSILSFAIREQRAITTGEFKQFAAQINFDEAQLATNHFDVTIDTASATTHDAQRDNMLTGADFLATARFPQAHFVASNFKRMTDGRYQAQGQLTLRGVTHDLNVAFTWQRSKADAALLSGEAVLNRLDFGVGQGDWQGTDWVGNEVHINFDLQLRAASQPGSHDSR